MKLEVNTQNFYIIGLVCFIGIGIFNLLNLIENFNFISLWGKFSSSLGIFFNFVVAGFFYYLLKNTLMPTIEEGENVEDLKKIVKAINLKNET